MRTSEDPTAPRHVLALDGVRGCAILLVILSHSAQLYGDPATQVGRFVRDLMLAGWLGVDVFFVLSGFLITGILVDARGEGPVTPRGYYPAFFMRRVLRIFPIYYAFLLAAYFIVGGEVAHGWWWYGLYAVNVLVAVHGWNGAVHETGHLWSLGVEEQFYLVWPSIIAWLPRRRFAWFCGIAAVLAIVARYVMRTTGPGLPASVLTPVRVDAFAWGGLVALAVRSAYGLELLRRHARALAVLAGIVLAALLVREHPANVLSLRYLVVGIPSADILTAAVIGYALVASPASWLRRALEWRVLRNIGKYSYAMYLVHIPLREPVARLIDPTWHQGDPAGLGRRVAHLALLIAASWAAAWVSWRVLEAPFLSLKRYFVLPGSRRAGETAEVVEMAR